MFNDDRLLQNFGRETIELSPQPVNNDNDRKWSSINLKKSTILFASETGKSESFARNLQTQFSSVTHIKVQCMKDYEIENLKSEHLLLIVASTYGNGVAPENEERFSKALFELKQKNTTGFDLLKNLKFSVFALGNSSYPQFCAFGKLLDNTLEQLGAQRINDLGLGDELKGQEVSFKEWSKNILKKLIDSDSENSGNQSNHQYRLVKVPKMFKSETELLSAHHSRGIYQCELKSRTNSLSVSLSKKTNSIILSIEKNKSQFTYESVDCIGICPKNNPEQVNYILSRLVSTFDDQHVRLEFCNKNNNSNAKAKEIEWSHYEKLPICTIREALTYLCDITTPINQDLLLYFSKQATLPEEISKLKLLATDSDEYDKWKRNEYQSLSEVLLEFSSVIIDPAILLSKLPILQPRYYTIRSSPKAVENEIHLNVAVVEFQPMGSFFRHEGLCSKMLDELQIGGTINAFIKKSENQSKHEYRLVKVPKMFKSETELLIAHHNRGIYQCQFKERTNLQSVTSERKTNLIILNIEKNKTEFNYEPGDHIGIYPTNCREQVDYIIKRLEQTFDDQHVRLEFCNKINNSNVRQKEWSHYEKLPICTIREALTYLCDITTPINQDLLFYFAKQATLPEEIAKLKLLATNSDEYDKWRQKEYQGLAEVLLDFSSVRIDPAILLSKLSKLQPRYYSISSSQKAVQNEVHLTVGVTEFQPVDSLLLHEGLCSKMFDELRTGETVNAFIKRAPHFHLPSNRNVPIVMVGAGTGIAPFRSFWQEYSIEKSNRAISNSSKMALYFGCRSSKEDDLFHDEIKKLVKDNVINSYYVAYSKEPGQKKLYVQDKMADNSVELYRMLVMEKGHFYICGNIKLAEDVTKTLDKILNDYASSIGKQNRTFVAEFRVYVQDKMVNKADELYGMLEIDKGHFCICGDIKKVKDVTKVLNRLLSVYAVCIGEKSEE